MALDFKRTRDLLDEFNFRSLIATLLPKGVLANHKLMLSDLDKSNVTAQELLVICSLFNSFIFDFMVRWQVITSLKRVKYLRFKAFAKS